MIKSYFSYS